MSQDDDSAETRRASAADTEGAAGSRGDAPQVSAGASPEPSRPRLERFVVRGQAGRFRVMDIWTGETAVIAMTTQDELSEDDAAHTAGLLNRRAAGGDRSLRQ